MIFFIIFENNRLVFQRRICNSILRQNFVKRNSQQPASVGDLQRYVTIMESRQSYMYDLINLNRIDYYYVMGMQSKCKYSLLLYECSFSRTLIG